MTVSAEQIFTQMIAAKIKEKADAISSINAVYEFNVTGEQGGIWTVDFNKGGQITKGSSGSADCTVTISDKDLSDIIEGNLNSQMAFMTGKLKVAGNIGLALKLGTIL